MGIPTEIAKQGYAAFGKRDIPALLELLADDVEWRFLGSPETGTPYGGTCKGKQQVPPQLYPGVGCVTATIQGYECFIAVKKFAIGRVYEPVVELVIVLCEMTPTGNKI